MSFTLNAKKAASASWEGSFNHPFITELQAGTWIQRSFVII